MQRKKMENTEKRIRDTWNMVKSSNVGVTSVPEAEETGERSST